MKLILHIFRKDVRHFFPEILAHVALLIVFAATAPLLWEPNAPLDPSRLVPVMLKFLIPQMWLVLISRVVHDEGLVGDRQFWITRPYPWQILLTAKAVFIAAFLNVPVLLTQMYLLHRGGLLIAPAIPDLLRFQGMVTLVFTLPFLALAVVTASFGRHILSVVAGLIYLGAVFAVADRLTQHKMSAPNMDWILLVIVTVFLAATVLVMYARRPVRQARITLLLLPPGLLLLYLASPLQLLVRNAYAATTTGDAIAFDPDPNQRQVESGNEPLAFDGKNVLLEWPIQFKNPAADHEATADGVQITLRNAGGFTWRSPYESQSTWLDSHNPTIIGVFVPVTIYDKLRANPVELELRVAVQTYTHGAAETITVPASGIFAVPGHGYCDANLSTTAIQCRYPLRSSPASLRQYQVQEAACNAPGTAPTTLHTDRHWLDGLPLGLDPVNIESVFFGQPHPGGILERHLCPGAHVAFIPEQKQQREELTLTRSNVSLPLYAAHRHLFQGLGAVSRP